MKQEMKFRFYGQQVEAILIDGDPERRDEWFISVDGEQIGRIYDGWAIDETAIMRFVERKILESLKDC